MKSQNQYLWGGLLIAVIIAVGGYFFPSVGVSSVEKVLGLAGDVNTTLVKFVGGVNFGRSNQLKVDNLGSITQSYDGFEVFSNFTVATTSPVRASYTNKTDTTLMCSTGSVVVFASSTSAFTPSFKYVFGTTTTDMTAVTVPGNVGYSANLIASTTMATTTLNISTGAAGHFILPVNSSVTLSVGDNVANASSTYYGNWSLGVTNSVNPSFSIRCYNLGQ